MKPCSAISQSETGITIKILVLLELLHIIFLYPHKIFALLSANFKVQDRSASHRKPLSPGPIQISYPLETLPKSNMDFNSNFPMLFLCTIQSIIDYERKMIKFRDSIFFFFFRYIVSKTTINFKNDLKLKMFYLM